MRAMRRATRTWSPESWKAKSAAMSVAYGNPGEVQQVVERLRSLPPLVSADEVVRLKALLAEAQRGERFVLQGGDCAESIDDCRPERIFGQLKLLFHMALVLAAGMERPVVRVGRIAGQYAKPRSQPTEVRVGSDGAPLELPSYFGDLFNGLAFTEEARRVEPRRMLSAYYHAALTLNYTRSVFAEGVHRLYHPSAWDLGFLAQADGLEWLDGGAPADAMETAGRLSALAAAGGPPGELHTPELFTSHEGLSLLYEYAQTRTVPHRDGYFDLTTHLPWIGERTRALDGAHVEFFRGVENPVGVKLGPSTRAEDVLGLLEALNPEDEPGKIVLIARMGADHVAHVLPPLIEAVRRSGRHALWMCDPMHGNTRVTAAGVKTRHFDQILQELVLSLEIHERYGRGLGGVHLELVGDDVTECIGGVAGVSEGDLGRRYATACDPRLNYRQALEVALHLSRRARAAAEPSQAQLEEG